MSNSSPIRLEKTPDDPSEEFYTTQDFGVDTFRLIELPESLLPNLHNNK